jgi:hypothetical protein
MTYDQAIESLEAGTPSKEALELAADALAFVQGLHQMFSENGMTSSENPTLNELENLIDATHGELGAACLFLCEPSFSRVPDMLRGISKKLESAGGANVAPVVVVKGFDRLAKRIENTRIQMQSLVNTTVAASNAT